MGLRLWLVDRCGLVDGVGWARLAAEVTSVGAWPDRCRFG